MTALDGLDADRLAVVVHEVRSPVAALRAISEAAAPGDTELRRLVELALSACRTIARVIGDVAASSVALEQVDVGRLVRESVAGAELAGGRARAVVPDDLPSLRADPIRLRQALDNLVANALAHGPADGTVVVAAVAERGTVLLSVSDEGEGIPAADRARIFEAGVRLDDARPGAGLGLAIARSIAEAHCGTLTLESGAAAGTTFVLTLPTA